MKFWHVTLGILAPLVLSVCYVMIAIEAAIAGMPVNVAIDAWVVYFMVKILADNVQREQERF